MLLERVAKSVEIRRLEKAARECYAVERIWKLLSEIEDFNDGSKQLPEAEEANFDSMF